MSDFIGVEFQGLDEIPEEFTISDFYFPPLDPRLGKDDDIIENPFFSEIEEEVIEFARKYNILLPGYRDYYDMAAFLYPQADKERMLLISKIMMILFYIDDVQGEHNPDSNNLNSNDLSSSELLKMVEQLFKYLTLSSENRKSIIVTPERGIKGALQETLKDLIAMSNTQFVKEFLEVTTEYLYLNVNLSADFGENMEVYLPYRLDNSGMKPTVNLVELAENVYIDKTYSYEGEVFDLSQTLAEIRQVVEIIGCLSNDLISFPKEYYGQESNLNMVVVIMREKGITNVTKAFYEGIKIVNSYLDHFDKLEKYVLDNMENIEKHMQTTVEIFLKDYWRMVSACRDWQLLHTHRYYHYKHPIKELRVNTITNNNSGTLPMEA